MPASLHFIVLHAHKGIVDHQQALAPNQGVTSRPLVRNELGLRAELEIQLLRPLIPGKLLAAGDIDNQLKSLIDALKIPRGQQWPDDVEPPTSDDPLFVLLEDDNLVDALSIRTGQLLTHDVGDDFVQVTIWVRTTSIRPTYASQALG